MKKLIVTTLFSLIITYAQAQVQKLSGPRIGITLLEAGSTAEFITNGWGWNDDGEGVDPNLTGTYMTQYGWQWESRFADGGEITGIVEWVLLVGGMEKGMFLPSTSSLVGLRTSQGIEVAAGPNLSLSGIGFAVSGGYNFVFGNLNVPVNVAFVPSKSGSWGDNNVTGARFSVLVGFNLRK